MQKLKLSKASTKLRLLAYGNPGSGKTTLVGSAALDERTSPVLHIDASGNPESLLDQPTLPDFIRLDKLAELNPIYAWLAAGMPAEHKLVTNYGLRTDYKTVVFDGITAIQRKSFEASMGTTEIGPGDLGRKPTWDDYYSVLAQMLKVATYFYQTLNMHVLITALEHSETRYRVPGDKDSAYKYADVALQGRSQEELPGEALAVMRLTHVTQADQGLVKRLKAEQQVKREYSLAQLLPNLTAYAKDQHHFGREYILNPTVTLLLDLLQK